MEFQCGSGFVWFKKFEKKNEGQWVEERDQSDLNL